MMRKSLKALQRASWGLHNRCPKNIATNISILKEHGVPQSSIAALIRHHLNVASSNTEKFAGYVDKVVKMGFNPRQFTFINARMVFNQLNFKTLEQKVEVYKKWGLSEDEIWSGFRKHPLFLQLSEKKIMSAMDFLVNKMCWQPGDVAQVPSAILYSLEKRIFPRCSVIRVLQLKGLIKQVPLSCVVVTTEKLFLDRFVIKFQDQVPQLLNIYHGKTDLLELGFGFEETNG
ncbi:hypothetical protein Dsin_025329 [Dipteronia sinensis]|uniref:Uncharacterized protein n=1 Tax=Dipteronia sinensis TaxID=43782 RepID=A0AAD9ZVX2_9ROSI|nr:hypothetical protein Dsin_025329 [Dipteronia sinensis]